METPEQCVKSVRREQQRHRNDVEICTKLIIKAPGWDPTAYVSVKFRKYSASNEQVSK